MSCCFMFYPFKSMDSLKSDGQSSMAEYLEKEKLCQEICETITKSVEGPNLDMNCNLPASAAAFLPELNTDEDVEEILQQISDLLGSQVGENSQCTDVDGTDELSVDEILKQAEEIVNASTPYFDRSNASSSTGVEPLLEPIRKNVMNLSKQRERSFLNETTRNLSSQKTKVAAVKSGKCFNLEVRDQTADKNKNSPTPTIDSDDDGIFESPVESLRPETPVERRLTVLKKSCSDSECNIKVNRSLQKSSSAGGCNYTQNDKHLDKSSLSSQNLKQNNGHDAVVVDLRQNPENQMGSVAAAHNSADDLKIAKGEEIISECVNADKTDSGHVSNQMHMERGQIEKNSGVSDSGLLGEKLSKASNVHQPATNKTGIDFAQENELSSTKDDDGNKAPLEDTILQPINNKSLPISLPSAQDHVCQNEEHCSIIVELKSHIKSLSNKVSDYEKFEARALRNEALAAAERQRIKVLQEEVKSQEELILGYQQENQRLTDEILTTKESWKAAEARLIDKVLSLEKRLSLSSTNTAKEKEELNVHLKQAYDLVKKLESEASRLKKEKTQLKERNDELIVDVMRLNCELEEYKNEYKNWSKNETEKLALMESNAIIQSKLSQANTEATRKQTEIIRLNGEIGRVRGELEKIRLGSVVNQKSDSTGAVSQLQAALAMERDNCNVIARERDVLDNEVKDLRKRVALLDNNDYAENNGSANRNESIVASTNQMTTEIELTRYKIELEQTKDMYIDLQNKYDRDIVEMGQQIKKLQKENLSLKHLLNDQAKQQPRKALVSSKKEDAHLLATIRGLQTELSSREKDIARLNKELVDARKTNRRLQQEREKVLTTSTSKMRGSQYGKETESAMSSRPQSVASAQSAKEYNPHAFEDHQEALLFLRNENRTMLEEIKRLEQDLISLHNKRIQDMSDLQEQHDREMNSLKRDHAAKHSSSTVANLQGQLYTQQMVINHLKQQIKEYEERCEDHSIVKAERDHYERALIKAKQKIARLNELASPENIQYASLLEKLEYLERRHEIREEKLQSIVKDLIAKQRKGTCSENCRDKIMNKNREICYYRAEMDKILATLAEFRWN